MRKLLEMQGMDKEKEKKRGDADTDMDREMKGQRFGSNDFREKKSQKTARATARSTGSSDMSDVRGQRVCEIRSEWVYM